MASKIQSKHLDEIGVKMAKKWEKNLRSKIWRGRRNSKSKWRRRLLQAQRCHENRSSEAGCQQYWLFITHVSIL